MIYLVTGTPGASKTLNAIKETCENPVFSSRPIYYNNIRCLALDLDFLNSFEGYFYTDFLRNCTDEEKRFVQPSITSAHKDGRLVSKDEVAFLSGRYSQYDYLENFKYWVKRLYPKSRSAPFFRYLEGCNNFGYKPKLRHIKRFNLDWRKFDNPHDWYKLPFGSVIVIDEVQNYFPKRSAAKEAPEFIQKFNTHRHYGFDLRLITQDSSLVDYNLKSCVGRHIHYKNRNGGEKVSRFEHSQHINVHSTLDLKTADKQGIITRDKSYYGSYYSAEVHTHKFVLPDYIKKLWIWIALLFVASFGIYYSLGSLFDSVVGDVEQPKKSAQISGNTESLKSPNIEGLKNEISKKTNCVTLASGREYCM